MASSSRDAGLIRAVGPGALAANIVNILVGAGIFAVPAALAASVGPYAPLAFLACAVAVGGVAICFAEGGSRVPTSGGVYGYIEAAFGPLAGFVAGTLLWVGDLLACGGVLAALGEMAASIVPPRLAPAAHVLSIVSIVALFVIVNIGGVSRGARLVTIATSAKLLPLAVFVAAGAFAIHAGYLLPAAAPPTQGIGRALLLALFTLMGMEAALAASGEVKDPSRSIPRALAIALGSVAVLYITVQVIAQGILGPALPGSAAPLADAMARVHPALRVLLLGGAGLSIFGWIASDILSSPRILFGIARDGLLPRPLGAVHPRWHTPHVAIACYALAATALALTGTFADLAVVSTLPMATLYIIGCAAAWRLKRDGVAEAGEPLGFRWLRTAAFVGAGSMVVLIALARRAEIVALVVLVAISVAWYQIQRVAGRARPAATSALGD
jgi:amino acid transporter